MASPSRAESTEVDFNYDGPETSLRSTGMVLDTAAAEQLLTEHMVKITRNVNFPNLKPYLIQYKCITMDDDSKIINPLSQRSDTAIELVRIISRRGAFEAFIGALEHSVRDEPGERGHQELAHTLREAARMRVQEEKKLVILVPSVFAITEEHSSPPDEMDKDMVSLPQQSQAITKPNIESTPETTNDDEAMKPEVTSPQSEEQVPVESIRNETDTGTLTAESNPETDNPDTTDQEDLMGTNQQTKGFHQIERWYWFGSIGIFVVSPLLLIIGITLLVFSFKEFAGEPNCEIGANYSLSIFNLLFGLFCLSVPCLLITFILYFRFEQSNETWRKNIKICSAGLTVVFFLACFVLTIGECIFSLLYVAQEVYDHYSDWQNKSITICNGEIYVTSFTIITVSSAILFLILVGLGILSAIKCFQWITDSKHPGALRQIIFNVCYGKTS